MLDKIAKRDILFKLMIAIEIAMLPLVLAAKLMDNKWLLYTAMVLILASKMFMILLKNPASNTHLYLDAICNTIVLTTCLIVFCCYSHIHVALICIVCPIFALEEAVKVYFYYKPNNQIIEGLNFVNELFMFITLSALMLVDVNQLVLTVSVVALIISSLCLVCVQGYKFVYYYILKNQNKKRY